MTKPSVHVVVHSTFNHSGAWASVASVAVLVAIGIVVFSIEHFRRKRRDA